MDLDTSVEGSDIYMLAWEKAFLDKLLKLGWSVNFYKRYVDDIMMVALNLNKGWYYSKPQDKMLYNKDHDNINLPDDIRTFQELLAIGNTLDVNIQLELDVPSHHQDNKLPILDLKVWVEGNRLRHQFYRKEVATNQLILQRSAISNRIKRDTLFQEGIRILRNCDIRTDTKDMREVLGGFCNRMRISGYGPKTRKDIIRGVLERSKVMEENIRNGTMKRYRNRDEIIASKESSKGRFKNTWFLRGEHTCVMKVQPTPNSELSAVIRGKIKDSRAPDGGLTKVVEGGGLSIIAGLTKSDPFRSYICPFNDVCWTTPKTDCWKTRTVYRASCCICGAQYTGTSGTSLHKRTWEHMDAVRRGDSSNAMSKHFQINHPDTNTRDPCQQLFKVEILASKESNLDRYITEGIWIEDSIKEDKVPQLNSKGEWGRVNTRRLTVVDRVDS